MNLEEVEKSIDKEINELKKSVSKLYKDWDKETLPSNVEVIHVV